MSPASICNIEAFSLNWCSLEGEAPLELLCGFVLLLVFLFLVIIWKFICRTEVYICMQFPSCLFLFLACIMVERDIVCLVPCFR